MPKIFISYRRKSWPFTHRLTDQLHERLDADIFVDVDSIDQTDFESAIVNHLRKSDVVLLVVSETTFADRIHRDDDWVRREIRETLERKIPLALVCVEGLLPPSGLPDDIKDVARMQGINFYPEYFTPGVEKLTDFVAKVSPIRRRAAPASQPVSAPAPTERSIGGKATLDEALALMERDDYDKAIFLLEALRESGYTSRFFKVDDLLDTAQKHARDAERRRTAQIEYDDIVPVVKSRVTRPQGLAAFQQWCLEYPDLVESLDTQNLRELVAPPAPSAPKHPISLDLMPPPFAWIEIPKKGYSIAKYPITNAQFAKFIEADGYKNQQWWTKEGWQKRQEGWHYDGGWKASGKAWTQPRFWTDSKWNGTEHPVVGVSWYEAIAFCLWMSDTTRENIMLPTEDQWQYAAQSDDGRDYPWGKKWDASRCNNNVDSKGIGKTTPVRQYEGKGDSPFGVVDMAGNVWEWCLTDYGNKTNDINSSATDRVLRGGSWNDFDSDLFRCDDRFGNYPHGGSKTLGFRVSRS